MSAASSSQSLASSLSAAASARSDWTYFALALGWTFTFWGVAAVAGLSSASLPGIALLFLGGLVALVLSVLPTMAELAGDPSVAAAGGPLAFGLEMGRSLFFELGTLALAIGVIVLWQDAIVDEKQSGVAEWLLAKPVARRSYILAKLAAALLAVLVLLILPPALAAYGLLSLRGVSPHPPAPFLAGLGIMTVHTLFYLTLTLMLGTLFGSRPPILGISLGVLLGGSLLVSFLKPAVYITPWIMSKTAALAASSQAVPPELLWPPLLSSALWCLIFVLVALAKFEKTEF